jgi:hypothetical protein
MDDEKRLGIKLFFGMAAGSDEQTRTALKKITGDLETMRRTAAKTRENMEKLGSMGTQLAMAGAAITAPLLLAANKYVQTMGQADAVSKQWIATNKRIEQSQVQIGKAVATAVLPALQLVASAAEKFADFAEKNPLALKAILGVGTGLLAVGGTLTAAAQIGRSIATIQLLASAQMQSAAKEQLAAAAGMQGAGAGNAAGKLAGIGKAAAPALAVAGGIGLGVGVYDMIAQATGMESAGAIAGKTLSIMAAGAGFLTGSLHGLLTGADMTKEGLDAARDAFQDTSRATGVATNELRGFVGVIGQKLSFDTKVASAYGEYQDQLAQAEIDNEKRRTEIADQYGSQRAEIEERYESQRAETVADFAQQIADATSDFNNRITRQMRDAIRQDAEEEKAYYANRAKMAAQYGLQAQRMEEDHQRKMRQLSEDHAARSEDLVDARDALGLVREQRDYERNRSREEESYQVDAARRSQDYALQLAEAEANYQQQRAQRLAQREQDMQEQFADFQRQQAKQMEQNGQRLADMDAQFGEENKKVDEQEQKALDKQKSAYADQTKVMEEAFVARLRALDPTILGDYEAYTRHLMELSMAFQNWLEAYKAGTSAPGGSASPRGVPSGGGTGRASGGYVSGGLYWMGEEGREYVLNNRSTRMLEGALGGGLSQELITGLVSRGGGRGGNVSLTQNYQFHGTFNDSDRQWFRDTAHDQALEAFRKVVEL